MAKNWRTGAVWAAIVTALLAAARPAGAAQGPPAGGTGARSGVRSSSGTLRMLIDDAIDRSQAFRRLVDTIETSDAIVYVEDSECRHKRRGCLVAVTRAVPRRMFWVRVDARHREPDDVAATIGHELQHVLEVVSSPTVTDNATLFLFYDRDGPRPNSFETEAAIQAGDAVRAELRRAAGR